MYKQYAKNHPKKQFGISLSWMILGLFLLFPIALGLYWYWAEMEYSKLLAITKTLNYADLHIKVLYRDANGEMLQPQEIETIEMTFEDEVEGHVMDCNETDSCPHYRRKIEFKGKQVKITLFDDFGTGSNPATIILERVSINGEWGWNCSKGTIPAKYRPSECH